MGIEEDLARIGAKPRLAPAVDTLAQAKQWIANGSDLRDAAGHGAWKQHFGQQAFQKPVQQAARVIKATAPATAEEAAGLIGNLAKWGSAIGVGAELALHSGDAHSAGVGQGRQPMPQFNHPHVAPGMRIDGTRKGAGWLGEIRMPNGRDYMTEKSVGQPGTNEIFRPAITPGVHPADLNYLRETDRVPEDMKATSNLFAKKRISEGLYPFKDNPPVAASTAPVKRPSVDLNSKNMYGDPNWNPDGSPARMEDGANYKALKAHTDMYHMMNESLR